MTIVEELRNDRESGARRLEGEYKAGLMILARRLCADPSDAEELVNRTFAAVVEGIDGFLEQSSLFTWMCRILNHIYSTDCRRKSRQMEVCQGDLSDVEDDRAQDEVYRNLDAALVRDAIDALSPEHRETLLLHYFMDIPVAKMAKILAVPAGTVHSRLHYARKALAAKLGVKAHEMARKPGAKALLVALALACTAALGAGIYRLGWGEPSGRAAGEGAPSERAAPSAPSAPSEPSEPSDAPPSTFDLRLSTFNLRLSTFDQPTQQEQPMNTTTLRTFAASAALAAAASGGTTYTWLASPASQDWNTSSLNWKNSGGQSACWVDSPSDPNNAVFPSGSAQTILLSSGPRYVNDITVNAKHTFTGSGNGRLNVAGTFSLGASITFQAGFTGNSVRIGGGKYLMDSNHGRGQQLLTYIEGEAAVGAGNDLVWGPVPASPSVNIVVSGGSPCLLVRTAYGPNRLIRIADGATLRLGNNQNPVLGSIQGTISGDPDATLGFSTNTILETSSMGWGWKGTVVLDPGTGRTNDVGRLNATLNLKLASGVTRLGTGIRNGVRSNSPFYVHGNNAYSADFGNLLVDGAEIFASQSDILADVESCAQITVTNGGRINMPHVEWLQRDARLTIANGGSVELGTLRLYGPSSSDAGEINIEGGGTLATRYIDIYAETGRKGTVRFNGGRIQSSAGAGNFMRLRGAAAADPESYWSEMRFLVCGKGAVFDVSNGRDIYWSRPLLTGVAEGASDGGLTVAGADAATGTLVFTCTNFYSGPTVISNATLQARVDYALPANSTPRLIGGDRACFYATDFGSPARHTTNSFVRVEGSGICYSSSRLLVDGSVAPDCGGELLFNHPCHLSGNFEIRGDAAGCGMVKVENGRQDISALTLTPTSMGAMRSNHRDYRIFEGEYVGVFRLAADFPEDRWKVRYQSDGVYLVPVDPTVMVIR